MRVVVRQNTGDNTPPIDMSTDFEGAALGLLHMEGYSFNIRVEETVADLIGTFKLQGCNNAFKDNTGNEENPNAYWTDITGSSVNVDGTGNFLLNTEGAYYAAVRLVWEYTSGEGDADIVVVGKGPQS